MEQPTIHQPEPVASSTRRAVRASAAASSADLPSRLAMVLMAASNWRSAGLSPRGGVQVRARSRARYMAVLSLTAVTRSAEATVVRSSRSAGPGSGPRSASRSSRTRPRVRTASAAWWVPTAERP
ncbi:hypothetical protein ACFQ2B_00565 [Streptomyces stramineus]